MESQSAEISPAANDKIMNSQTGNSHSDGQSGGDRPGISSSGEFRERPWSPPKRTWFSKFFDAGRGITDGIAGQSSFAVHLVMAAAVVALAAWLGCSETQWCLLIGCITMVLTAELFNSALEWMARGLCDHYQAEIGKSLDIASGAVLVAATGAAIVGIVILLPKLIVVIKPFFLAGS